MLFELQVKLDTGFFGGGLRNRRNVRALELLPNGCVQIPMEIWQRKLSMAAKDLRLDSSIVSCIQLPVGFVPPTIRVLKRRYRDGGTMKTEYFEGFGPNTVIHMDIVVADPVTEQLRIDVSRIFQQVGQYYGISQFGSKNFGLGRFMVTQFIEK